MMTIFQLNNFYRRCRKWNYECPDILTIKYKFDRTALKIATRIVSSHSLGTLLFIHFSLSRCNVMNWIGYKSSSSIERVHFDILSIDASHEQLYFRYRDLSFITNDVLNGEEIASFIVDAK
jgi:hypothetical protein